MTPAREYTFCFIDMAGFTALTEAHGDELAADLVERFVALVTRACDDTRVQLVSTIGDGAFVVATRPEDGVRFVTRVFGLTANEPDFPALRAGLHHGEALERGGNYVGASVNLAARVASQAAGCQALSTSTTAEAAARLGTPVESVGTFTLRNVRNPIELFSLRVGAHDERATIDPVCRMSLDPNIAAGRLRHQGVDYWFCSLGCAATFAANPAIYARE